VGILDSKTRVIDAIITQEGRRQLAAGDMRIEYVSFSDAGTYYAADISSGSADATKRIYLEACNLPQDQITFEADDSGRVKPFKNQNSIQIKDGQIVSYSFQSISGSVLTGTLENATFLKGDEFASQVNDLLESSIENFKRLQTIASRDFIFEDDGFGVGNSNIEFTINNNRPISNLAVATSHIDHMESLFNDPRLSGCANFKYLPPINKIDNPLIDKSDYRSTASSQLGYYKPWGRTHISGLTYPIIKRELSYYEDLGYCKTVNFDPTSKDNKLVGQFFEKRFNQLTKLDVIDYGKVATNNPKAPVAHIFFVGRIMVDNNETSTFIHLFTLIFE
jgi:hypothetical protein